MFLVVLESLWRVADGGDVAAGKHVGSVFLAGDVPARIILGSNAGGLVECTGDREATLEYEWLPDIVLTGEVATFLRMVVIGPALTEREGRVANDTRGRGLPIEPGLVEKGMDMTFSKLLAAAELAGMGMLDDLDCLVDMALLTDLSRAVYRDPKNRLTYV